MTDIQKQLSALHRRKIIAAELDVPAHLLGSRPRGGLRTQRAARVLQLYRPRLRAAATSLAVGAAGAPPPPSHLASGDSTPAARVATANAGPGNPSQASAVPARIGAQNLRDSISLESEFEWVMLVSRTLPQFYRSRTLVPGPVPPDGGQSGKAQACRDASGKAADEREPGDVFLSIQQHLLRHPPRELAQRLLPTCAPAPQEWTTDLTGNVKTIYTGVAVRPSLTVLDAPHAGWLKSIQGGLFGSGSSRGVTGAAWSQALAGRRRPPWSNRDPIRGYRRPGAHRERVLCV
jgi:hypothetical protein